MEIVKLRIADLTLYEGNTKIHTEAQLRQLEESIKRYGFNDPIGVWGPKNIIVEGHGRAVAAQRLGYTELDCIRLDHLTEEQRIAYTMVHNSINLATGLDDDMVQAELCKLTDAKALELFGLILDLDDAEDVQEDDYVYVDKPPRVKTGEVWQLGEHTLVCGSCLDADNVHRAMGGDDYKSADCVVTDPPYNVDYVGKTKDALKIDNDLMDEDAYREFLTAAFQQMAANLRPGGAFYIWLADKRLKECYDALKVIGLQVRQQIIWVKNTMVLGRQDYQQKHEPCIYGWKSGAAHYFTPDRTKTTVEEQDEVVNIKQLKKTELLAYCMELIDKLNAAAQTVIREDKPVASEQHPTMKPVRLIAKLIANSTRQGDTVLDCFGGSGTTLIACEQMGRYCRMLESDEKYASSIVDRWEKFTGKTAEKIRG